VVYGFVTFTTSIHSNDCSFSSEITQLYFFKVSQQQKHKKILTKTMPKQVLGTQVLAQNKLVREEGSGTQSFKNLAAAMSCCVNAAHSKLIKNVTE